ncbi:MAG: hypothetical protein UMU04_00765 [Halanaerobiales bacterium]|nr:hypothetical protein [Halanaerobiales bacterium]
MLKKIGTIILFLSLALLLGAGVYNLFMAIIYDPGLPLLIKIALLGLIIALIVILIALIKERREDKKNEKYDHREY